VALERLKARIALDQLYCEEEADGVGVAEPYLWGLFFAIDGTGVTLDVGANNHLVLRGAVHTIATPGSLGNLGTTSVDAGDRITLPARIRSHGPDLRLEPIPLSPAARALYPDLSAVGGLAGVVVVLMENDDVIAVDAEIAHKEFNASNEATINQALQEFSVPPIFTDLTDDTIAPFVRNLGKRIDELLVQQRRREWARFPNYQNENPDDKVGLDTVFFLHQDFAKDIRPETGGFLNIGMGFEQAGRYVISGQALGVAELSNPEHELSRSGPAGAPRALGSPTAVVVGATADIVYRDSDGRLHELWRDPSGATGTSDLTALGAPPAAGDPFGYLETPLSHLIIVYRGKDDKHVHSLYWGTATSIGVRPRRVSATTTSPPRRWARLKRTVIRSVTSTTATPTTSSTAAPTAICTS
jgi:hypothetical protein